VNKGLPAKGCKKTGAEAAATLRAAAEGGEVSRSEVREIFEDYQLGAQATDPAERAEARLISLASNSNLFTEESIRSRLAYVRENLAQPGDGELERLLIHRVGITWLTLSFAEELRAQKWGQSLSRGDADFWDRHVSRLQLDFTRACKAVAWVRKLMKPVMVAQVNIADKQQINIGGEQGPVK